VRPVLEAFTPEAGAYDHTLAAAHTHEHEHEHQHGHGHHHDE
jgi:urease accessory protein